MTAFFQILIYGYGNPGREDDGLGIELVKRLEEWSIQSGFEGLTFDSNYQLNIEDAELISTKDLVVFVDASTEDIEDYLLTEVTGEKDVAFTTHAASPGYIVKLCTELFDKCPKVMLLHIKGYRWELKEGLSRQAALNLEKAIGFMKNYLLNL
ncbi:MAG: hydrogenase maturation protease [Bacteroidales bacterium]|nr:hydrogenase maturation protease [Bacteroidales bacterium]